MEIFQPKDGEGINLLLNTTSFSLIDPAPISPIEPWAEDSAQLWQQLNIPVLQVILSGGNEEQWEQEDRGLSPTDTAMNVALPEVDGRIISRAISFKSVRSRHPVLQTEVLGYQPRIDRVEFVADLAANWVALSQSKVSQRRVGLVMANYPNRDGRLANGVGLDTPASCIEIVQGMVAAGYQLGDSIPVSGAELIDRLTRGITNDPEGREIRPVFQSLSAIEYRKYFETLPESIQTAITNRWGQPHDRDIPISGIQLGHIFIGVQPSRGYDLDPTLNYHAPDLEPTHDYLAYYYWLRSKFGVHAIVHVGKHGNLEWLPGKSVALAHTCYPEIAMGAMPHFYPFIVNDPGEGAQAKRRSQAVIIDHLTPPMTRAELYGELQSLEGLVDEYYEAIDLDPKRSQAILTKIIELLKSSNLDRDLGLNREELVAKFETTVLNRLDRSLCELKEAQIRDGLHILGKCPEQEQLRDIILAISRHPQPGRRGITRSIALDWGLDFDPLTVDPSQKWNPPQSPLGRGTLEASDGSGEDLARSDVAAGKGDNPPQSPLGRGTLDASNSDSLIVGTNSSGSDRIVGDVIERIELYASVQIGWLLDRENVPEDIGINLRQELEWIDRSLLPKLRQTSQEIGNLLLGLSGKYIPSGPSGAPTRGRAEVLPTGRNFYSVDIRAIPTETAWDVGRKSADLLIDRYTQEQGEYPKTVAISIWGTSTMRTGGDDLAQALALIGVRPVWDGSSRRVVDFEILPLKILNRPRVDVTLRVSGLFRDAFPNLIDLFDRAVRAVGELEEELDQNPIAAAINQETLELVSQGVELAAAKMEAGYRVFGSKPGAYGAGLQGLIESQNWQTQADLGAAYTNWSSYAYGGGGGVSAKAQFDRRLRSMEVVLQNQDNREHDLLDSDDYYQFQGGLSAAITAISGQTPVNYFGDRSIIENPKLRSLQEEIARVYRSRVINPKWIKGVMRHGYKGAAEMAATVDFLFAYGATTDAVGDWMYGGVADAYLFDRSVRQFVQTVNPWAVRDMAERLLEAHQRGMWQGAGAEVIGQLQNLVLDAEGDVEQRLMPEQ
jgi:cobaltochelatase CobN